MQHQSSSNSVGAAVLTAPTLTMTLYSFRYFKSKRFFLLFFFRSEGSKLNNADEVTRGLWRKTFNVSFPRPGCMFRGNPPCGRLHPLTETYQMALLLPREIDVSIDKIQVSSLPLGNNFFLSSCKKKNDKSIKSQHKFRGV